MKITKLFSVLFILFLAITLLISVAEGIQQNKLQQAENSPTVIFAVSEWSSDGSLFIDPIVVWEQGLYIQPPPASSQSLDKQEKIAQFIANYYQPGETYRLLFGEKEIGTVTVKAPRLETHLAAEVNGDRGGTLATNSSFLGRKQRSSRRPATDSEQEIALELAKKAFQQNGVPDALLHQKIVSNLTAVDLDGDSNYELIGSFKTAKKTRVDLQHHLFMIIKPQHGIYRGEFIWYHNPQGSNISNLDDAYHSKKFIDLLDLDGEGIAEVILEEEYYEGNSYSIYKKQGNKWEIIYSGGGGGA
jgi:hypothetical protein